MWRRVIDTSAVLAVAVGLTVGGAACGGAAPANGPLPAGEPVAIGYATVTTTAATGAVESLSGRRLEESRATNIEDLLARFPGLNVRRLPDGRVSVRIRGPSTLMGSSEPLLVIDGIPVEYDTGGLLRDISPFDIVRIEVLKDDASTAIFGTRGGNGVIMITTKRAR